MITTATGRAGRTTVNHPRHYGSHPSGVECITVTEHMTFIDREIQRLQQQGLK